MNEIFRKGYEYHPGPLKDHYSDDFKAGWAEAQRDYERSDAYKFDTIASDCPWNDEGDCRVYGNCCLDNCPFWHWRTYEDREDN